MRPPRIDKSLLIKTLGALFAWKLLTLGLALLATRLLPFIFTFTPFISEYGRRYPYLVGIWGNFDGMHYLSIARHGYEPLKQAFFPLYPFLIWVVHQLTPASFLLSAILLSHLMFLLTLPFLYLLTKKDFAGNKQSHWLFFLTVLLIFPTSFFYGSVYNDATFFFFATLTIFFARKQQWAGASLAGGIATLARLNGLALAIYLLTEYWIAQNSVAESWRGTVLLKQFKQKIQLSAIWESGICWIIAIPGAFVGYLVYLQYRFGNWRTLFSSMTIWKQSQLTFPPIVLWRYVKILWLSSPQQLNFWVALLELLTVLFYCHVLLLSLKKIRLSYWIFIAISILIPWSTGTFQGMPRYALHLYPFFLACTVLLLPQKKWVKYTCFTVSLLVMIFVLTLFTRGYFVS